MDVFHVKCRADRWCLRENGTVFDIHSAETKEGIMEFVEGYMTCRAGKVIFYSETGSVEREKVFGTNEKSLL